MKMFNFQFSIFNKKGGFTGPCRDTVNVDSPMNGRDRIDAPGGARPTGKTAIVPQDGFTVTELIVAMGVFIVLVTIAVGVFVNTVRNQRRLTMLMSVNNNAGNVLEQIAREVRTGYRFCEEEFLGGSNPSGPCYFENDFLTFTNYRGALVTYEYDEASGSITRLEEGNVDAVPLTAAEVEVSYLSFLVRQYGDGAEDMCNPWRITITMGVVPRGSALSAQEVRLQTTVSSRVLPVEAPGVPESIIEICQ